MSCLRKLVNSQLTVDRDVDWVLRECQLSIDWVSIKGNNQHLTVDASSYRTHDKNILHLAKLVFQFLLLHVASRVL